MLYSIVAAALSFTPMPAMRPALSASRASVVAQAVPELYVYDHCPFCVRVRVALGVKGIKHKLVFMANDDVETPTALVGKKIAPIWVDDDGPMMESLDVRATRARACMHAHHGTTTATALRTCTPPLRPFSLLSARGFC